jgi:hypothetical protein
MITFAVFIYGQNVPDSVIMDQLAARIGLSEEETKTVMNAYDRTESVIEEANLELNIYKAQLARLLFPVEVDMREVENLLRKSYEWQLKRQLAQIQRQVEIRRILGEDRWAQYSRLIRNMQQRAGSSPGQGAREEQSTPSNTGR